MPYTPGPFNGPHLYLQWGGSLPGGESWSNGLRIAPLPGHPAPAYSDAYLAGAVEKITDFHTAGTAYISPRAKLQFVKLNAITVDGHYAEPVTHEAVIANVGGGGTDGNTPANQVALAVTLTTDVSRGPAHQGRFYMPLPAVLPAADGTISVGVADGVRDAALQMIEGLVTLSIAMAPAVMSRKAGAPASRFITGVKVGRVLDTQRRRRRSLVEHYE